MTLFGLKQRLKLALWSVYSDEFWAMWHVEPTKEKDSLELYHEECDALIIGIPKQYRDQFKQLLVKKIQYRMREGAKHLDTSNSKIITNCRLFEDINLKQHIERVEQKEEDDLKQQTKKKKRAIV